MRRPTLLALSVLALIASGLPGCDSPVSQSPAVSGIVSSQVIVPVQFMTDLPRGCEEAASWAEAHVDELPSSWAGFSALPPEYRTQVYDRLASEARLDLWRAHLDHALYTEHGLSNLQRVELQHVRDALTTEMFETGSGLLSEEIDVEALQDIFPERAQALFHRVGVPYTPDVDPLATLDAGLSYRPPGPGSFCNCGNGDAGPGSYCERVTGDAGAACFVTSGCERTSTGCGPFDTGACLGSCSSEAIEPVPVPPSRPGDDPCFYNPFYCEGGERPDSQV